MYMDSRQSQLDIIAPFNGVAVDPIGQTTSRLHPRLTLGLLAQRHQRSPPGEDDSKLPRTRLFTVVMTQLLFIQHAGSQLGALGEAKESDPGPSPLVVIHTPLDGILNLIRARVCIDRIVRREPAEPAAKRAPVGIDRHDARAGVAEEGCVDKDEAEFRVESTEEGAELSA